MFGVLVLGLWVIAAVFAPLVAPFDPNAQELLQRLRAPSAHHWLGTDQLGRDVLSRIIFGSRSVLAMSATASILGLALGTGIGIVVAYAGGRFEELVMRILDGVMAFPYILSALFVLTLLGPSNLNVALAISLSFAPYSARVVRSAILPLRDQDFVAAALMRGESRTFIVTRELLPNIRETLVVEFTIRLAIAVFLVATLSFLGLGVQPPSASWGLMVSQGQDYFNAAPWGVAFPSAAIASLVLAVNVIASSLKRDP